MSRAALALVATAAVLAAACDKVPLTAPTESTIQLFATATSVSPTGSTDIVATVIEPAGTPVQNGTVVSFTTTLGRIEPAEARTQNGKVTVKLTADGRSGVAQVTAFSGGAVSEKLDLPIGSAAAETLTVRAEPARLPPGGGSAQIVALARDLAGNPLAGSSVAFTTTAGNLSSGVVTTDTNGEARTTLTTSRETTVTATVGAKTSDVTVQVDLAPSVTIATSASPVENQPVTFTITVTPATEGLPITQARIDYGDGGSQQLGALSGTTSVQHVYRDNGTFTVTLTLTDAGGNVSTQRTVVVVSPAAPISVVLSATQPSPNPTHVVTFTATATPPAGVFIDRYVWEFSDGTSTTTGNQRTKTFAGPGPQTVRVTAHGTNGSTGVGEIDILVN